MSHRWRAPRRRRLRGARGAGRGAGGGGADAGAGEDPPREENAVETIARPRSARRHSRSGRGSAEARSGGARARLLGKLDLLQSWTPTLFELEPVEREAPTAPPHAGELGRLLGRTPDGWTLTGSPRREAAQRFGAVVLLKGSDTLVASPDGTMVVSDLAAVARNGGTGDVLTGVVAAFLSKGVDAATAAAAAAVAHGLGGRADAGRAGRKRPPLLPPTLER